MHLFRPLVPGLAIAVTLLTAACGATPDDAFGPDRGSTTTSTTIALPEFDPLSGLSTEVVATELEEPVTIAASAILETTFVGERTGYVTAINSDGQHRVLNATDLVGWDINEQGFLGIALHPEFPADPRIFAFYTDKDRDVVVSSFTWDGEAFDPDSVVEILHVPQPHKYHQGGGIVFGPQGHLWLSFGDGGGIGDKYDNGQNPFSLQGTIVRIDVEVEGEAEYMIPPSNPFAEGGEGDPLVWAFGLRNPWRITIDGNQLFIADVGQYNAEEINVVAIDDGGGNYGWPIMEGNGCYEAEACETAGLRPPTLEVNRESTCAIIGGPVYRGTVIPELHGHYIYGDFCTGWVRSVKVFDGDLSEPVDWTEDVGRLGQISTFGTDPSGEILLATLNGTLYRIVPLR